MRKDVLIGQILDNRYEIVRLLGQGGMGQVYEARQRHLDRSVAIKVIRPEISQDEKLIQRFFREAKAVAGLTNPHTVVLHDFGITDDGLIYFSMELLEGQSLSTLLASVGPLPSARAVAIAVQVCQSLSEAHDQGICHRDLKPDNLTLLNRDGRDFVKVLDFGLARPVNQVTGITTDGIVVGTPQYMSPEQARGTDITHSADIYSLGIVIFEMLTGKTPFVAETPVDLLMKHLREQPPSLSQMLPEGNIPHRLESVVLSALAKKPLDRPRDARQFAARLEEALASAPADLEKTETLPGEVVELPRRSPWPTLAVGTTIILLLALFWWSPWSSPPAEVSPAGQGSTPDLAALSGEGGDVNEWGGSGMAPVQPDAPDVASAIDSGHPDIARQPEVVAIDVADWHEIRAEIAAGGVDAGLPSAHLRDADGGEGAAADLVALPSAVPTPVVPVREPEPRHRSVKPGPAPEKASSHSPEPPAEKPEPPVEPPATSGGESMFELKKVEESADPEPAMFKLQPVTN